MSGTSWTEWGGQSRSQSHHSEGADVEEGCCCSVTVSLGVVYSHSYVREAKWVIPASRIVEMGESKGQGLGSRPSKALAVQV